MIRYEMPMEVVAGCPMCSPDREATLARNRLLCSSVTAQGAAAGAPDGSGELLSYDPVSSAAARIATSCHHSQ
jgi:hypothetical protein